jgi:hypothetical protein
MSEFYNFKILHFYKLFEDCEKIFHKVVQWGLDYAWKTNYQNILFPCQEQQKRWLITPLIKPSMPGLLLAHSFKRIFKISNLEVMGFINETNISF